MDLKVFLTENFKFQNESLPSEKLQKYSSTTNIHSLMSYLWVDWVADMLSCTTEHWNLPITYHFWVCCTPQWNKISLHQWNKTSILINVGKRVYGVRSEVKNVLRVFPYIRKLHQIYKMFSLRYQADIRSQKSCLKWNKQTEGIKAQNYCLGHTDYLLVLLSISSSDSGIIISVWWQFQ